MSHSNHVTTRASSNKATVDTTTQSGKEREGIRTTEMTMRREAIVKLYRLSETTINQILHNDAPRPAEKKVSKIQNLSESKKVLLLEMEKRLTEWVIKCAKKNHGRVRKQKVMKKALQLFDRLRTQANGRGKNVHVHFYPDKKWFADYRRRAGWTQTQKAKGPSTTCTCGFEDFDYESHTDSVSHTTSECSSGDDDSSFNWFQRTKASLVHQKAKELKLCSMLPVRRSFIEADRSSIDSLDLSESPFPENDTSKSSRDSENMNCENQSTIVSSGQPVTQLLKDIQGGMSVEQPPNGTSVPQLVSTDRKKNESSAEENGTCTVQNDTEDVVMLAEVSEENLSPHIVGIESCGPNVGILNENPHETVVSPRIVGIESCGSNVGILNENPRETEVENCSLECQLSTSTDVSETQESLSSHTPLSTSMNGGTEDISVPQLVGTDGKGNEPSVKEKGSHAVQNDTEDVIMLAEVTEENLSPHIVGIESSGPNVGILNENPRDTVKENCSRERQLSTSPNVSETQENLSSLTSLSTSMNGETGSPKNFRRLLEKVIRNETYLPQQIFNVREMTLFWKKLPESCHINEDAVEGQLAQSKDPVMLLLGTNASGDCKLEPLLVYSKENPSAISRIVKSSLPVIWKFHPRVKITSSLFEDWFTYSFIPTVQVYCLEHKITFKILLILDNSPCHSKILEFAHPNVKVLFLPSNGSSFLQPMDRGICEAFKANYFKHMLEIIAEVVDQESGETLKSFWKSFNILSALKLIKTAWCNIATSIITSAWKVVYSKHCPKDEILDPVLSISNRISKLASQLQLVIGEKDIRDWMKCHDYELTNDELQLLESESASEESNKQLGSLMPSKLSEAFKCIETAMRIFESEDPNFKRSSYVVENIKRSYQCYRQIYMDQKSSSVQANDLCGSGCEDDMDTDEDPYNSEISLLSPVDTKPTPEEIVVLECKNVNSIKKECVHL